MMDGDQQSEAEPATDRPTAFPVMTAITAAVWLLFIPIAVLIGIVFWATEDRQQRARRWRRVGWSQQRIADRLGCSRATARRLLA